MLLSIMDSNNIVYHCGYNGRCTKNGWIPFETKFVTCYPLT